MDGAVRRGHLELCQQRKPVAVQGATTVPAQPTAIPTVAEKDLEVVVALAHLVGHVVRLVAQPMLIARPTRREELVANTHTVQLRLVQPVRGDIQPGLCDGSQGGQGAGENRGGRADHAQVPRTDESGRPILGVEEAGLHGRRCRPVGPGVAPRYANADGGPLPGAQWCRRPGHEHLLRAVDGEDCGLTGVSPDLHVVRRLLVGPWCRRDDPGQSGRGRSDAEHAIAIRSMLEAKIDRCSD